MGVQEVEWAVGWGWQHTWKKNGGSDGQVGRAAREKLLKKKKKMAIALGLGLGQ